MSSSTPSQPSGSDSKDRKLLPSAIGVLTIAKESLDGVPVLGLKAAVGGLLEILKAAKRTSDNNQDLIGLDAHLNDLSNLLTSINENMKTNASQEFNDRIAKLTRCIFHIPLLCMALTMKCNKVTLRKPSNHASISIHSRLCSNLLQARTTALPSKGLTSRLRERSELSSLELWYPLKKRSHVLKKEIRALKNGSIALKFIQIVAIRSPFFVLIPLMPVMIAPLV
ncbi:hypothetical protein FRC03_007249 [Tulasnella sp. 419]|nr:hypothetical protein FRC03_007249 [Tulasnella sp. 419]